MRAKSLLKAAVLAVVLLNLPAARAGVKELAGHVPAAAKGLKPTGHFPGTNVLSLAIGLPLRNQADINSLMQQIYDPASPLFRQYLTPETFTARFGPLPLDYQQVIAFAQSNGFQIIKTHQNRVLLDVRAKASDIERAFNVHLLTYQHPSEPREFFAPDVEPSVDAALPILDISGLNNYGVPHPMLHPTPSGTVNPASGSQTNGAYWGLDFRRAYAPGVTQTGAGQSVGLMEFQGYYASDITNYEHATGLPNVPLQNVALDGFTLNSSDSGGISEVSLDIEVAMAMATGLTSVVVFEAPNSSAYMNDILNAMAASNQIKQFSSSWGFPGGTNGTTDAIFQQMALQGQSFFQAAGDGDAWTGAIEQPSDNPYVTVVGGTTLTMNGYGSSYSSETVWDWGYRPPAWPGNGNGYWGSGGGVSTYYSIPTWQQGISINANKGSHTMRNIPDVALTADQIWVIYDQGLSNSFGGTSCAAPLWAGFAALINQKAVSSGRPTVGFINPAIYALGYGASYTSCFNDITNGNNTNASSGNLYFACPGYDLCTGWGTPNGLNLITALATPDSLGVLPGNGFSASGTYGGPFNTNNEVFTLTNSGASSLTWSGINTASWLSLSTAGGTLAANAGTTATVSLNSTVATLPPGTYAGTVIFSNATSKVAQPRQFSLTVSPLELVQNGGFETGDFTGWTLVGDDPSYTSVASAEYLNSTLVNPHSGTYMAILATDLQQGTISQTLTTTPGQSYVLSFWISGTDGSTPNQINAIWNGTLMLGATNLGTGWVQGLGFVKASGASSTLQFAFEDDYSWVGLDDVSVQPVPPPVFQPVTKAGSTVNFQWYAVTNLAYQLQYKTNLTQTNWLNLGSPITATNLLVSTADISATNRVRFYRVVVSP